MRSLVGQPVPTYAGGTGLELGAADGGLENLPGPHPVAVPTGERERGERQSHGTVAVFTHTPMLSEISKMLICYFLFLVNPLFLGRALSCLTVSTLSLMFERSPFKTLTLANVSAHHVNVPHVILR